MSRTIVCGHLESALGWCRSNGIAPFAKTTSILTPAYGGGRGLMLKPDDRVVFVGDADFSRTRGILAPAGLGSVVQPEFVT